MPAEVMAAFDEEIFTMRLGEKITLHPAWAVEDFAEGGLWHGDVSPMRRAARR